MTEPDRKFEEEIRRALCAASDLIVPAGDGLNLIRERAARRPPALRWLLAYAAHLPRQLVRASTVAASEVAATIRGYSSLGLVLASARRWPGKAHRGLRTPSLWLRPVLATATALLLVIAVTLSIPRLRQTVGAQLDSAFGSSSGQGSERRAWRSRPPAASRSQPVRPRWPAAPPRSWPGQPFLATMPPPGAQCRAHGTGETAGTATRYVAALAGTSGEPDGRSRDKRRGNERLPRVIPRPRRPRPTGLLHCRRRSPPRYRLAAHHHGADHAAAHHHAADLAHCPPTTTPTTHADPPPPPGHRPRRRTRARPRRRAPHPRGRRPRPRTGGLRPRATAAPAEASGTSRWPASRGRLLRGPVTTGRSG